MPDQNDQTGADAGSIRVLIADPDARVRNALRTLIEAAVGIVVVGEAATGGELLREDNALKPSVILLNLALPSVTEALRLLRELALTRKRPVVAISVRGGLRGQALAAGARTFVEIGAGADLILSALRVAAGEEARPSIKAV